ncbi:hypothetical protein MKX03_004450 [Papaver bracteatum]|nr:hypothetical protein MKX03_004450 [Papaver bracteatum]
METSIQSWDLRIIEKGILGVLVLRLKLPLRRLQTAWETFAKKKVLRTARKTRLSMMNRLIHGSVAIVMIV